MPLYEYECANQHRSTVRRPIAERRDPFTCACGTAGHLVPSLPGVGKVIGTDTPGQKTSLRELAKKQTMAAQDTMVDWKCEDGHVTIEVYRGEVPKECPCETCGKPTKRVIGMPQLDTWTDQGRHAAGGYYDVQLGRWFNSKQELRDYMAENNIGEGGDDRTVLLRQAEAKAKADEQDRIVFEMLDRQRPDEVAADKWALDSLKQQHPDW